MSPDGNGTPKKDREGQSLGKGEFRVQFDRGVQGAALRRGGFRGIEKKYGQLERAR